jgi:hypothetical protein
VTPVGTSHEQSDVEVNVRTTKPPLVTEVGEQAVNVEDKVNVAVAVPPPFVAVNV